VFRCGSVCDQDELTPVMSRDVRILHMQNFAQNWLLCAELTKRHRNCKIMQILFSSIVLSLALTAPTARTNRLGVKVIK